MFTLCPRGNSAETIRLFDALEAGSIPVLVGSPEFLTQLPGHPFVLLKSWDETKEVLEKIRSDSVALAKRQQDCIDYYEKIQSDTVKKMQIAIDKVFQD